MKNLILVISLTLFSFVALSGQSQFNFPKTPSSIVSGFYNDLAKKPAKVNRGKHAAKVFDKYFSRDYLEKGGKGNKLQNFDEFKAFVSGTFTQLPNLNVNLEEIIESGEYVTVKINLNDKEAGIDINYLALYHVEEGKITSRYAYSDGAF